jgi:clan AA aspartic protease
MGLTMVKVKITNLADAQSARAGLIPEDQIRSVEVEALVDTGAISMAIPEEVAELLGAGSLGIRTVTVADGRSLSLQRVGALKVEVLGRDTIAQAYVLPRGATPLLGAIELEYLDLVVVPSTQEVIANPAHPDGPVGWLLRAS